MPVITNTRDSATFDCEEGDTILRAALRAGLAMPYSCNTGSCGNCRFELVEGKVQHLRQDPPAWSERDLKRNRWLGCQATPQSDCTVKFRQMDQFSPPVRPARRAGVLTEITPITRDISEFHFRIDRSADFRPGQYALIEVPGVDGPRAYSMSNLGSDGDWRFMIKKAPNGAATGWLFDAEPGAEVMLDGPYGTAFLDTDSPRDIVLLAGGSGLSPMVSIARGAVEAGMLGNRKLHVFYGARNVPDLCDPAVLGPEAAQHAHFVTALSDAGADWDGPRGFLHDVAADTMGDALKDCDLYFAGPAVMSAAVQKMAHAAGVPGDRLHFDEFY